MGIKLGDISPLAGAITGKGALGEGLVAVGDAMGPAAGLLPMLASQLEIRRRYRSANKEREAEAGMKKGGKVKKMAKGGSTASKRADGCAKKGKTRGKMV
jgi:hypothetical protein